MDYNYFYMDISIIITAHNESQFINDALSSALKEKLNFKGKCEIILAFDGEYNGQLKDILTKFDKVIFTGTQKNLSYNFNNGVSIALGKYVKILAYDDILYSHSINQLFIIAEKNNSDVVFGDYTYEVYPNQIQVYKTPLMSIKDLILMRKISCGASLFKKESFLKVGGFDTQFNIAEGYCLYLRLMAKGFNKFNYANSNIIFYRIHDDNKSNRDTKIKRSAREIQMKAINTKYKSIIETI